MHRKILAMVLLLAANLILAEEKRPNIILFVADDLSRDLGCYGNKTIRTPNFDALAAAGVRFEYSFCTTASCSSSRSVLLSGMHNHTNGQYGLAHNEHHFVGFNNIPMLPNLLAESGYRTAIAGKLHVLPEPQFEETLKVNARNTVQMAEACREFISAESEKPFFLYFCPVDPHRSNTTTKVGEVEGVDLFGNVPQGYTGVKEEIYTPSEVEVPPYLPDTPACRAELAQYYQSASRVDQGLGRLREILAKAGVEKNTIIICTSDNGIAFPGAKTTLYEPGMRIPLIVYAPGVENPQHVCNGLVSLVDMTPTILDFAGVKPPAKMQGRSWRGILPQENPAGWDEVQASHTFHEVTMYYPMRVIRGRKYKLIWNLAHKLEYPFAADLFRSATWQDALQRGPEFLYGKRKVDAYVHRPEFELYDLENDPHEIHNLADAADKKIVFAEMLEKLKSFQKETTDPWIIKWEHE